MKIKLNKDTIDKEDIDKLIDWLKTYPRLTKGKWNNEFEEQWCRYLGCKYSVFVNSGSSANLASLYAVKLMYERNIDWNKRVIIPTISWATDMAPAIQLGFEPYLCDASKDNLGVDLDHFESLCKDQQCKTAIIVHVLGIPAQIDQIKTICDKYNVIMIEDCCESVGSTCNGQMVGNFGLMSTFSTFFAHHFSTIEGGIISTNNRKVYNLLKMLRNHGWDRDVDEDITEQLRTTYNVNDFDAKYTFYVPAFNIRSTDLQAFIGVKQIGKLYKNTKLREKNYQLYQKLIKNDYWKLPYSYDFISNFAYPIIHPKRNQIAKVLTEAGVECRPLISGSHAKQPYFKELDMLQWKKDMMINSLPFADIVHKYGMYVPNHPKLTEDDIQYISDIVNKTINT